MPCAKSSNALVLAKNQYHASENIKQLSQLSIYAHQYTQYSAPVPILEGVLFLDERIFGESSPFSVADFIELLLRSVLVCCSPTCSLFEAVETITWTDSSRIAMVDLYNGT